MIKLIWEIHQIIIKDVFYLPGFGGSRGAFFNAVSELFFSILGDFEDTKFGLGTKKFGLESIPAFNDLSDPFAIVDCSCDVGVIRWEFFFFSICCKFTFDWSCWAVGEDEVKILSVKSKDNKLWSCVYYFKQKSSIRFFVYSFTTNYWNWDMQFRVSVICFCHFYQMFLYILITNEVLWYDNFASVIIIWLSFLEFSKTFIVVYRHVEFFILSKKNKIHLFKVVRK